MDCNVVPAIVKKVFPEGTELCLNGKAGPLGSRFWMIPGKGGEPRWILPHDPKYALPFLNQWRPYDFLSRIKWKVLLTVYRGKRLGYVPGVLPLRVIVPEKSNWEYLGWHSINPPVPVIYVGTPCLSRKAVFGLVNSQDGMFNSLGKAPLGPESNRSINHEVEILDELAREKPGRAPRKFFHDRENGIATQEFFTGNPTSRTLTERHVKFLADLEIPGEVLTLRETAEELWEKSKVRENPPEIRKILEQAVAEADASSPLPAVWEHGDFAPWNLKATDNGALRAIDWESGCRKGIPLFDLVYFRTIQAFLFREKKLFPKHFWISLRHYLEAMKIPLSIAGNLIRICIIRDWMRCMESGNRSRADFLESIMAQSPGVAL